jgi:hypothetical protein
MKNFNRRTKRVSFQSTPVVDPSTLISIGPVTLQKRLVTHISPDGVLTTDPDMLKVKILTFNPDAEIPNGILHVIVTKEEYQNLNRYYKEYEKDA